jgi:hypothetical protein
MEYLDVWASSKIFFFGASFFGTTSLFLNQKVPSASSQKQATFRSPSCIKTPPKPVPETSQETSNSLMMLGWASKCDVVNNFFKFLNASSQASL